MKMYFVATFCLLTMFCFLSVSSVLKKSPTWDETHSLGLGIYLMKSGKWGIPSASLHPPLSYYLNSLPLLFCDLNDSCFKEGKPWDIRSGVKRGQCILMNSSTSGEKILFVSRLSAIFTGVALGIFVFIWSLELFGIRGALISLFLYCFSPNILAHTRLITPDIFLTSFGFITSYFFWKFLKCGYQKYILLSGIFLGLTILSKYPGIVWLPILVFLTFLSKRSIWAASPEELNPVDNNKKNKGIAFIIAITFLVILFGYQLQLWNYPAGIIAQMKIVGHGFPAYLNGMVSRDGGWWFYHIFAFSIKTPLPVLAIFSSSLLLLLSSKVFKMMDIAFLVLPIIIFFAAFSIFHNVNIGIRYILPCYPFLIVISGCLATVLKNKKSKILLVFFLFWVSCENIAIYPHYLAYFNQIAGGPENGHYHLIDSNLDWGQDLPLLKQYMDEHNIEKIKLSYFGSADPDLYGIKYEALPSFTPLNKKKCTSGLQTGDVLAVSVTNLYPVYVDLGELSGYLRKTEPIDTIGYSINIYIYDKDKI